ncbi:Chromosomal replication initiator protein DnaA [subsurface metagenome]|nr:chromosomal replication initiator protein DnaA [Clostridia bacterium]
MVLSAEQLWNEILNKLKEEMPKDSYELWFKPTRAVSFEDNLLNVQVPNRFFSKYLQEKHKGKIEELLRVTTASEAQIIFTIDPQSHIQEKERKDEEIEPTSIAADETTFTTMEFNPKYTFENFVVGPSNRFAHATAEAVANDPGKAYNPLFIYGGVGLGKTHLLQAIGHYNKKQNPRLAVLYITSERFTNELIESIRNDRMVEFRNKYRHLDVLMIDDIQFLVGKESTQEEFFHLFNTLYEAHKQIVISSDSTPKEIPTIEERLRSRFQWGVIADIQPPDIETRIAILRKKAEAENIFIPDDVVLFLASQIKSNIRELEGCLIRIVAFSSLTGSEVTVDRSKEILKDIITKEELAVPITIELIQNAVSKHFHLDVKEMKSKKRTDAVAFPRQVAMYLARTLTEYSTTEIGADFGGRDHTTVMYACEKIKMKLAGDPFFAALINKITQEIKTGV